MSLFPLPLTPFETLLYLDARADYPMIFYLIIDVRGHPDRSRLEKALATARARHPLLNAVVRQRGRHLEWVPAESAPPPIHWCGPNESEVPDATANIDLASSSGIQLHVIEKGINSLWIVRGHHSCCDGMGIFLFLDDLLAAYHQLTVHPAADVQLVPLVPEVLRQRGNTAVVDPNAPRIGWLQATYSYLRELGKFFLYRPHALKKSEGKNDASLPYRSVSIDPETAAILRRHAGLAKAHLNDLLLRELFLTIDDWNDHAGHWRITMPVSLRDERHEGSPAANIMSYAFLHRSHGDCHDPDAMLQGIATETGLIKQYRLAEWFLSGLQLATGFPRLLRGALRWKTCFATAVLSNVSDPSRRFLNHFSRDDSGQLVVGDLVIENLRGVPPMRPLTRLTMAVSNYAGKLSITGMGCPHTFGPDAVERFLRQYAERLERRAREFRDREVPAVAVS